MSNLLYRVARWIAAHRLPVLVAWLAIAVALALVVARVGADTSDDLSLPGTDSQAATDLLAARFPPQQNGKNPIVFQVGEGTLTEHDNQVAVNTSLTAIRGLPHVVSAVNPFSPQGAAQLSADRRTAFSPVLLDIGAAELTEEEAQAIVDATAPAQRAGIRVAAGAAVGSALSTPETETSELVGILAAMIILTFAFGTIVAMGMPISTAIVGLVAGLSLVGLMGHLVEVPSIAPTLATMIGLGVGIDYSLFLVSRHRNQMRRGVEVRESIARAVGTTGTAIVFAGGTVVIALLALAVAGIPLVTSLGYASAVAVVTAVLAAVTLLPALLSLVGGRIESLALPALLRPRARDPGTGGWARWAGLVTRHPWWAVVVSVVVVVPLAIPVLTLNLGQEDIGATPPDTTERQAYDMLTVGFGVGYNGPLLIAVDLPEPAAASAEVQQQEDQLTSLQSQLDEEQEQGRQMQAELQEEGAELTSDQAALERQQASLEAQQQQIEAEAGALEARRRGLEASAAALQAEAEGARSRARSLEGQRAGLRSEARGLLTQARALVGEATRLRGREAALRRGISAVEAEEARTRNAIAATSDPERRRRLQRRLDGLEGREQALRAELARAQSEAASIPGRAVVLRRQAESLRGLGPRLRAQAQEARGEAAGFAAQTRDLASQAAALARQGAQLAAQAADLERQAAALQQQAATLKQRKAALDEQEQQLEALQAKAKKQQQQAEQLQDQLTEELTKAGGDARGTDPRLVGLQDDLAATPGVDLVSPPQINEDGDAAIYSVIATSAPAAVATANLVRTLRSVVIPQATAGTGMTVHVGGQTASYVDLADEISARLPVVIVVVLVLSILVLAVAFRSLLVPLQAAIANLLAVGAAFGVLTVTFQWGWGIDPLHIDTASDTVPIASFVPLMMFAVLFGLSMDYQVFLLSQVALHRAEGEGPRRAVASAITYAGKVIAAAALIMIAVFGSYILDGDPTVKQFGVGLAAAVALAGGMVLLLTPALLCLFGPATWWLPRRLDRIIPDVDVEGEGLMRRIQEEEAGRRAGAEGGRVAAVDDGGTDAEVPVEQGPADGHAGAAPGGEGATEEDPSPAA